jgi:asparagine synthase (glutamine-hydrolysing)
MSAIAGLLNFDGKPDAAAGCGRMLAAQHVYGRDAVAQWAEGPAAVGRCLFRVLPEDQHDRQPLIGFGGGAVLVADVRIDNREEMISALGITANRAKTLCDAAVLLAACERWQETVVDHVVGDYAFALWHKSERRLTLARDCLGQRPLHYHRGEHFFAFASMPNGLHVLPDVPYGPDEERIAEFLALIPNSGARTMFRSVSRVEPGHIVTVTKGGISSRRYWQPSREPIRLAAVGDYVEAARDQFDQATRARLRGVDGLVGAQLSAGLDSAAVVSTAARLLAPTGGKVVAFTAAPREGYDGPAPRGRLGDEGPLAAATAAMYDNVEHVLIRPGARTPLDDLDRYVLYFARPMLNLCNGVWMSAINDAARERKLKIMLSGASGNMTLSYDGYELLPELLRRGRLLRLARQIAALGNKQQGRWLGHLAHSFGPFTPVWLWNWLQSNLGAGQLDIGAYSALRADRIAALGSRARERGLDLSYRPWADGFAMRLWALRRGDPGNFYQGGVAGWGIDNRDPTADRRLVEFCLRVPLAQYLADGEPRALAKRVLADRVPEAVLQERRKGYQAIDWHEGLTAARGRLAAEIDHLGRCVPAVAALDLPRLRKLVEDWPAVGWEKKAVMEPYRLALLRGISAGHFLRKTTGTN